MSCTRRKPSLAVSRRFVETSTQNHIYDWQLRRNNSTSIVHIESTCCPRKSDESVVCYEQQFYNRIRAHTRFFLASIPTKQAQPGISLNISIARCATCIECMTRCAWTKQESFILNFWATQALLCWAAKLTFRFTKNSTTLQMRRAD